MNYFTKGRKVKVPGSGRKPSKKTLAKMQKQRQKALAAEERSFNNFLNAKSGDFNGFEFVELFHRKYDKSKSIFTARSDDSAIVNTPFGEYHAGADGVNCYFLSKKPKKRVLFNRSVYFI